MQDHLDRDALERLVHRRCHASRAYGWLLHLLACTQCRERVVRTYPGRGERFLREIFRTQEPLKPPDLEDQDRLDRVLENLQTYGLAEYLQEGDIPPLLADLHRHPPERQRLILDNTERLWNLGTVEYLFERCESEAQSTPSKGRLSAELILWLLHRLHPDHYHPRLLQDLKGRALGLRANFLICGERFTEAKQDLRRAATSLKAGTGDIDERIRFLRFCGFLASSQRQFERAIQFHEEAVRLSRASGNHKAELKSTVSLVGHLPDSGRCLEAIRLGEEYLDQVSVQRDDLSLLLALRSNLALALIEAGHGLPAFRLHREVLQEVPADQPRLTTKVHWMQFYLYESLGDFETAESIAASIMGDVTEYLRQVDYGVFLADRARLALRRRDHGLARRYGREARRIFEQNDHPHLVREMQGMLEGGPLAYF